MSLINKISEVVTAIGADIKAIRAEIFSANNSKNSPVFTYTNGSLSRVSYSSGDIKNLTYASGVLVQSDLVSNGVTTRKEFIYSNGSLAYINQAVLP